MVGSIYMDGEFSVLKLAAETFVGSFPNLRDMVFDQYPAAELVVEEDIQRSEAESFQWLRYRHNSDTAHDGWGDEGFRMEDGG